MKLSFDRSDLDKLLNSEAFSSEALIDLFERDFRHEYSSGVGVSEGHSLREHTIMVLNQFEKYFGYLKLPGAIDNNLFRVVLVLHDIGKPRAVREGNKKLQSKYNSVLTEAILKELKFSGNDILIAKTIVSCDPIGDYLKHGEIEKSRQVIIEEAGKIGLKPMDLLALLTIYFTVDAGSYTLDAGGKKSLDHLFVFNPDKRKVKFSPKIELKMKQLKKKVENK